MLIKLEISSCRCSQLECNEESDETESYSALFMSLLPSKVLGKHTHGETSKFLKSRISEIQILKL